MKKIFIAGIILTGLLFYGVSEAVQTKIVVRVRSKDAKFVGSSMGGALVIIKDSETGKVLAEGLTSGATGDTNKIMIEPKERFGRITDDKTAKYETSVDIKEPKLVTVEVEAPYGKKPETVKSSTQLWLIPGKHIVEEGLVIEVHGFSVDADTPGQITLVNKKAVIPVQARIVMI